MPHGTQEPHTYFALRLLGYHHLWRGFPDPFNFSAVSLCMALQPRRACTAVWAVPLSLATTQGIVSFPPGTKMFQFPGFPAPYLCVQYGLRGHAPTRVSPFGHLRFKRLHTPHQSFSQCTTSFIGS